MELLSKIRELTFNPPKQVSYAYCSDTVYKPEITEVIKSTDLLYHESTFLKDKEELTTKTKHSTAEQAAKIAKMANVGQLILGHYSNRYDDLSLFKKELKLFLIMFSLAEEGKVFKVENLVNQELLLAHQN